MLARRSFGRLAALGVAAAMPGVTAAPAAPRRGGTLNFLVEAEPPTLVTIAHTAGGSQRISPKVTEGLLTYDFDFTPQPVLATSWSVSGDGLRYAFKLREGVRWHDGRPLTAEDVAFSILLAKQVHPRGRGTFANVIEVQVPDPLTAVIVLAKPAPYLLTALDACETPIVAKHIYEGTDALTNPNAAAPIGTGPFVFKEWVRGSHAILERNPDYWDAGKPYLDRVVVRFIPDQAARAAAFETGEIDLGGGPPVALSELDRISALPHIGSDTRGYEYIGALTQLFFNFQRPLFQNIAVRRAIAHAINLELMLEAVWYGHGKISPTPISPYLARFHDPSLPAHAFDPKLAEQLLDEAGYPRQADGTRLALRLYNNPYYGKASGEFIKQSLARVGIAVDLQVFDFSTYIVRTYTDRDFDLTVEALSNTFDPTLGVQRAYWSKNSKVGLPFSNAAHYGDQEVDQLLEAAAVEPDEERRQGLWRDFQKAIHDQVASVTLIAPEGVTLFNKRVKDHTLSAVGVNASFADLYLEG